MIGTYINFSSQKGLKKVEKELEALGGFEVGGHGPDKPCMQLCAYSVDGEEADFTEDECLDIRKKAEDLLRTKNIQYSITVSA